MCAAAAWIRSEAFLEKGMRGQQSISGQTQKGGERMLSRIKDNVPLLHSPMLKSSTSSPNKP